MRADEVDADDALPDVPDAPLVRLEPVSAEPTATISEVAETVELHLQLISARVQLAIARAWDSGTLSKTPEDRPPFEAEVFGLLGLGAGFAPDEVAAARDHVKALEDQIALRERFGSRRRTTLDALARDFGLGPIAMRILLVVAAPRLRGTLARLYKIVGADGKRALVDEQLVVQILGESFQRQIARELDADMPLRRYGLVTVTGERPTASLAVDPLVVRFIANRPYDGELDPHLVVRRADRDLGALQMPRAVIVKALQFLAVSGDDRPARIVVRGRTGSGRHTLLASLAARAGRDLGVIDIATMPRDALSLAAALELALRRAKLRGLVPCVDGLEAIGSDDPDARTQVAAALRKHPGPLALRLPVESEAFLDPGYLLLEIPQRTEQQRTESWRLALERYQVGGPAPSTGPSSERRVAAESSDPRVAAHSSDHRVAAESTDHRVAAESTDHRVAADSSDHRVAADSSERGVVVDPSELASRYRVGPGVIERVCAEVARRAEQPEDAAAWLRELDDAVRQHLENRLGKTATRVTRLATWADVVLPEDIADSLLELTARVRHRKQVFEHWGFDRSITSARGITALFQGSPGTGKTMVAGVIARDLGLELYRVDVSRISSKWLGETEKNLGALFDAAEDGQVMLLFDEADSLFAKRTEVKTSVDRYANMEVNYLLQRLDSFEGIAILTTNFGNAIDSAFKRRLTYRVTFPFPDEEMREQLWRSLIPPQVPIEGVIDYAALARRFRLSGGYIRNAALRAAFLAAEEGVSLTQSHIERAVRMEFREIGKLAETGVLE